MLSYTIYVKAQSTQMDQKRPAQVEGREKDRIGNPSNKRLKQSHGHKECIMSAKDDDQGGGIAKVTIESSKKKCHCGKRVPYFAEPGNRASHCDACKTKGMVNVKSRKCACGLVQPLFGRPGGPATHCVACKLADMVNVRSKRCHCGASVGPCFGHPGGRATHCSQCKTDGMVDVKSKRCACGLVEPLFGRPGGPATHCAACKLADMVNVRSKRCHCGASVGPSFGHPGGRATHCVQCKTNSMVAVKKRMCHCGKVVPSFGQVHGHATHCAACRLADMINLTGNKCWCGQSRPHFGFPGSQATHCSPCKLDGMVNVNRKMCRCGRVEPCFGYAGGSMIACASCRTNGMIDLKSKRCEGDVHQWQPSHERPCMKAKFGDRYLCSNCLLHALGASGSTLCRAIRREHIALGHLVTEGLPRALGLPPEKVLPFYHDTRVLSCNSVARPDLHWILPRFAIVIEFDENGHADRTEISEMRHLEVIRQWALKEHGLWHMYVLRINERGLFKWSATGSHTGLQQQPREIVWVPTEKFLAAMEKAAQRLVPWFECGIDTSLPLPAPFDPVYGVYMEWV